MHKTSPHLDGQYAAFGKVIEGMDVVNEIAEVDTDFQDRPLDPQVMKKVTAETLVKNTASLKSANCILKHNTVLLKNSDGIIVIL